jgi:hypothetical protein
LADSWEQAKFQAWVTYASQSASQGQEPLSFEDWLNPKGQQTKRIDSGDHRESDRKIKSARKISAKKKAEYEAAMNAIP